MFDADTIAFLGDLRGNNTRDWFAENRARYEAHWKAPAKAFSDAMAAELQRQFGGTVSAKVFRINRDIRFSKDKTPYNAHIHMSFASEGRADTWMVGLDPDRLTLGYGLFQFTPAQLDAWRQAVDGEEGATLAGILEAAQVSGRRLDAPALKRVPAPYDKDHPQGDLLRRKGLALWRDGVPVKAAFGADAVPKLAAELAVFAPLRRWLRDNIP